MSDRVEKFASQADATVLAALRAMAKEEGKQFYVVLEEAMKDYIQNKKGQKPRAHVMDALRESLLDFDDLYKELAK